MERFDEQGLSDALANMPEWKQIAFMLMCCGRMIPNYERFSADSGFGDATVLRHAAGIAWAAVESGDTPDHLDELRAACDSQAPKTEDFVSRYTSAALDAANATATVLDAIEAPNTAYGVEVARLARDTVDLYLQECLSLNPKHPSFEDELSQHPLMQAELRNQKRDLDTLREWSGTRQEFSRFAHNRSLSSLDGSLPKQGDTL
jgi:uncharacterized protein YjaG (DUF416 family)